MNRISRSGLWLVDAILLATIATAIILVIAVSFLVGGLAR
jgi:hypothetical protein